MRQGRPALRDQLASRRLTWWPELGVGFYPVEAGAAPYDAAYFERYSRQAATEIGRALMRSRSDFVARHWKGALVDIGIGSGAFIEARRASELPTFGWDVNPMGMAWLNARCLAVNPYALPVAAISLWDVLEHIEDFRPLLAQVQRFVFVSLPVFTGAGHVLTSKHFRRDEHCWYFTALGLIGVMAGLGFDCVEHHDEETRIGREDIQSFAFQRKD